MHGDTQDIKRLIGELSYATQKAEILANELKEARSLLAFGLEARQITTVNRALLYGFITDPVARKDILDFAKMANDSEVVGFIENIKF